MNLNRLLEVAIKISKIFEKMKKEIKYQSELVDVIPVNKVDFIIFEDDYGDQITIIVISSDTKLVRIDGSTRRRTAFPRLFFTIDGWIKNLKQWVPLLKYWYLLFLISLIRNGRDFYSKINNISTVGSKIENWCPFLGQVKRLIYFREYIIIDAIERTPMRILLKDRELKIQRLQLWHNLKKSAAKGVAWLLLGIQKMKEILYLLLIGLALNVVLFISGFLIFLFLIVIPIFMKSPLSGSIFLGLSFVIYFVFQFIIWKLSRLIVKYSIDIQVFIPILILGMYLASLFFKGFI
uniref:Uncharacterized protein n=1 Tax=Vicia sepium TaxID=347188 RepID=A0A385CCK8_9FABA|nr:hypothetical protein [Vicia sepium]AXQ37233.1 hypothetical protein [Vicia sepium]